MIRKPIMMSIFVCALITAGCSNKGTTLNNSGNSGESSSAKGQNSNVESIAVKQDPNDQSMLDYFLPDGSKAQFKTDSNQYEGMDIDVAHPYKNIIVLHENDGGILKRHIYRVDEDQITELEQGRVNMKEDFPSLDEISSMESVGAYLKTPIKVGTTFDQWKIVETDVTVETPYKTFDDAFIIESTGNAPLIRKYFAKGFGEVKREVSIPAANNEEQVVTYTLQAVSEP